MEILSKLKLSSAKLLSWWPYFIGIMLIGGALSFLVFNFRDVLILESQYQIENVLHLKKTKVEDPKQAKSNEFTISVPKVGIDARVYKEIDPYNTAEYKEILTKGAAHAKGSALPGNKGNVFIFAHSTSSQSLVTEYNAIFYLLNKLDKGDEVYLSYGNYQYKYKVTDTKIIDPEQVEYLENNNTNTKTVTLMTCWPAGTSLKRLLIIGEIT